MDCAGSTYISDELYAKILSVLPLVCVDVVIRNPKGQVLLAKRNNNPLKGEWYIIGGRARFGESLEDAARRKAREELGCELESLRPAGFYEDTYEVGTYDSPCHSVSIVYEARLPLEAEVKLDRQHSEWKWGDLPERIRLVSSR